MLELGETKFHVKYRCLLVPDVKQSENNSVNFQLFGHFQEVHENGGFSPKLELSPFSGWIMG